MASKPNLKKAGTGALQGAAAGSAAGPWGALGGAVIGGVTGLLSGDDDSSADAAPAYKPDASAFYAPSGWNYFGDSSGQPGGWWGTQAGAQTQPGTHVRDQRMLTRSGRGMQEGGLGMIRQYATGNKSAARLAAKAQTEATQDAIASRAASAPGGYNPAVQRAAIMAQSGAGQQIAGKVASAAAAEQLAAQKAYLQATGQMRQQDISQQLAEQQWFSQQAAANVAYQNMKARFLALGLQEKDAENANRKGYSKHKPAKPLYTKKDAENALKRFKPVDFVQFLIHGDRRDLNDGPMNLQAGGLDVDEHGNGLTRLEIRCLLVFTTGAIARSRLPRSEAASAHAASFAGL